MNALMKIPYDKIGHMIAGVIILMIVLLVISLGNTMAWFSIGKTQSLMVGMAAVTVVAVGKEWLDSRDPEHHTADIMDTVATVSLAFAVSVVFHII